MADTALIDYNDPNEFNPLYTADVAQAQQRYEDLAALLADVDANPGNYENAEYLTEELNNAIRSQEAVVQYAQAQQQYNTVSNQLGTVDDNWYAANAANDVLRSIGMTANYVSADQVPPYLRGVPNDVLRSIGMTANYVSADQVPPYLRGVWQQARDAAFAARQAQRDSLVGLQGNVDTSKAGMIDKYYITRPDLAGMGAGLEKYYYGEGSPSNPMLGAAGGAVGKGMYSGFRSIYGERDRAVKWAGSKLASGGLLDSGTTRKVQQGINAKVLGGLSNVAEQSNNEALANLSDWKTTSEDLLSGIADSEKATKLDALSGAYGSNLSNYLARTQLATQRNVSDIYGEAQRKINENQSSLWGDLGSFVGNVGSTVVKAAG